MHGEDAEIIQMVNNNYPWTKIAKNVILVKLSISLMLINPAIIESFPQHNKKSIATFLYNTYIENLQLPQWKVVLDVIKGL